MNSDYLGLFSIEYLSSVTGMVLAVNLITQIIKEIFFVKNTDKRIPKVLNLAISFFTVSLHHVSTFISDSQIFHSSPLELIFSTCFLDATSGTTPPNFLCKSI